MRHACCCSRRRGRAFGPRDEVLRATATGSRPATCWSRSTATRSPPSSPSPKASSSRSSPAATASPPSATAPGDRLRRRAARPSPPTSTETAALVASQNLQFTTRRARLEEETEQLAQAPAARSAPRSRGSRPSAPPRRPGAASSRSNSTASSRCSPAASASRTAGARTQRELAQAGRRAGPARRLDRREPGRIAEIEIEILRLDTRLREEAIDRAARPRGARDRAARAPRTPARGHRPARVRAPVDGHRLRLDRRHPARGDAARRADPVIVPQEQPLIVRTRIEATAIDQVTPARRRLLKFPAFDSRTMPDVLGTCPASRPTSSPTRPRAALLPRRHHPRRRRSRSSRDRDAGAGRVANAVEIPWRRNPGM
jgi:hypothetical protein